MAGALSGPGGPAVSDPLLLQTRRALPAKHEGLAVLLPWLPARPSLPPPSSLSLFPCMSWCHQIPQSPSKDAPHRPNVADVFP